jgi:hypothetical protein
LVPVLVYPNVIRLFSRWSFYRLTSFYCRCTGHCGLTGWYDPTPLP